MTVCRLVDRMEAAGFVERLPNPADKRAKLVCLTEQSRSFLDKMRAIALEVYEEAFDGFDEEERLALIADLNRINENLSKSVRMREEEPV